MTLLAEFMLQTKPFWEYSNPPPGTVAAALFFLLLICVGIALDAGLVLHWIKRPVRLPELAASLSARALPPRLVLIFFVSMTGFYLLASWLYMFKFPSGEIGPEAVIFQTLFFHLPVLILLGLLFRHAGIQWRELFGFHWKKSPALLGLSILFYLAALPLLWFYSALYQILLRQFGCDFYLQDVAQILMAPAPWFTRTCLFFITIIVAPAFEEIVFRGILLPFAVRRAGFWPGMILISIFFGGLHLHLPSFFPLFLLSMMFSLAYARTRSLLVPIGMHAAFNGVTVLLLLLAGG
ncbi:MAG TPA: CPBP family intramembrane metalloprotease [Pontiellaceae bacterium]|nr:CPBP family intramembrane metalloprotease [Pontiellaceae bacterium]HPR82854.1 CPBP family intramembrane metalloprotease [Pontiellaceae bacterium]